jgi:hypothetical protein
VCNLRACGPLACTNNERAKQLLYALDDHVWGMKITALEESANFATLETEKLFGKLKSHELSYKGHPNHDASFTSKALITSACVGDHDANPTNTISHSLEFVLSSLAAASDEQYRAFPMMRLSALSASTPPTSSPNALSERSTTTPTRMTTRRRIAAGIRRRRTSRRSCLEQVPTYFASMTYVAVQRLSSTLNLDKHCMDS